jgi:hypothetical protein
MWLSNNREGHCDLRYEFEDASEGYLNEANRIANFLEVLWEYLPTTFQAETTQRLLSLSTISQASRSNLSIRSKNPLQTPRNAMAFRSYFDRHRWM